MSDIKALHTFKSYEQINTHFSKLSQDTILADTHSASAEKEQFEMLSANTVCICCSSSKMPNKNTSEFRVEGTDTTFGAIDSSFKGLSSIVQSRSFLLSPQYNHVIFNNALRAICNQHGLQEHEVEGPILKLYVLSTNTKKPSTELIFNPWGEQCVGDAANDSEYGNGVDVL